MREDKKCVCVCVCVREREREREREKERERERDVNLGQRRMRRKSVLVMKVVRFIFLICIGVHIWVYRGLSSSVNWSTNRCLPPLFLNLFKRSVRPNVSMSVLMCLCVRVHTCVCVCSLGKGWTIFGDDFCKNRGSAFTNSRWKREWKGWERFIHKSPEYPIIIRMRYSSSILQHTHINTYTHVKLTYTHV